MTDNPHHEHLIKEITEFFGPLFSGSPQGIYLYLDDTHKVCNEKFAQMLGYSSSEEWRENEYPMNDVAETDQERVIHAYEEASQQYTASTIQVTWTKKMREKFLLRSSWYLLPTEMRFLFSTL